MQACEQTKGQSVLEHGKSVYAYYRDLKGHLEQGLPLQFEWRLPAWLSSDVMAMTHDEDTIRNYQIYHDCGKPFCLEIDEEGRQHFPDHQKVSESVARDAGFNESVCRLIGRDMGIHLLKDDGINDFLKAGSEKDAITLLITGLCEVHSNAAMFGGIESVGFKQKWKQINKRGKKIANRF